MKITKSRLKEIIREEIAKFKEINEISGMATGLQGAARKGYVSKAQKTKTKTYTDTKALSDKSKKQYDTETARAATAKAQADAAKAASAAADLDYTRHVKTEPAKKTTQYYHPADKKQTGTPATKVPPASRFDNGWRYWEGSPSPGAPKTYGVGSLQDFVNARNTWAKIAPSENVPLNTRPQEKTVANPDWATWNSAKSTKDATRVAKQTDFATKDRANLAAARAKSDALTAFNKRLAATTKASQEMEKVKATDLEKTRPKKKKVQTGGTGGGTVAGSGYSAAGKGTGGTGFGKGKSAGKGKGKKGKKGKDEE